MDTTEEKKTARCVECDREMEHFITFLSPTNEESVVCWECNDRGEKGFNVKRNWGRGARDGFIPR
jgi:hypothetical protein